MDVTRTQRLWVWPIAWTPVYALNLIAPYLLASNMLDPEGWPGRLAGIAFYWAAGLAACVSRPTLGRVLVRGGLVVAVTQLVPILQFLAELGAVFLFVLFMGRGTTLLGFFEAIVIGGPLLFAAYFLGRIDASFWSWFFAWPGLAPRPEIDPAAPDGPLAQ